MKLFLHIFVRVGNAETTEYREIVPKVAEITGSDNVSVYHNSSARGFTIELRSYSQIAKAVDNLMASGLLTKRLGSEWDVETSIENK